MDETNVALVRQGWMQMYLQMRKPQGYFSSMFTMKPGNNYKGDSVSIDIERYEEDVAIVVKEFTGLNANDFDRFTTKTFRPPSYGEKFPLNVIKLINRMAGETPYSDAYNDYAIAFMSEIAKGFKLVDAKIQRGVELQGAQIMQTGKLSLTDKDGALAYELDFQPKAEHFPVAAVPWNTPGAPILENIRAVCDLIRANGQITPDRITLGQSALDAFLANPEVAAARDDRHVEVLKIAPELENSGAVYYGYVWVGTYKLEIWTYDATYKDPQTGLPVRFLKDDSAIISASKARLDLASAEVPEPIPDPRVVGLVPGQLLEPDHNFDITSNVYSSDNGRFLFGELESRPLCIPVQIDGFGCITTR